MVLLKRVEFGRYSTWFQFALAGDPSRWRGCKPGGEDSRMADFNQTEEMEGTEVQDTPEVSTAPSDAVVQQQSGTPVSTTVGAPAPIVADQGSSPHISLI